MFVLGLLFLTVVSILSVLAATGIGRLQIPWKTVVSALGEGLGLVHFGTVERTPLVVVFDIRLSRVVLSFLVGSALGVAGAVFQGILRNPLADPFTIGVASGAAFGAVLAIALGLGSGSYFGLGIIPFLALLGALIALASVVMLGRVQGRLRRDTLVLAGIVVATFLSALIALIKALDEEAVSAIVFWVMGSFQGRGWIHVWFSLPYLLLGLYLVMSRARELDILTLGEVQARQLGVEVERVRRTLLVGASLLTAAAVSVSGVIGFVGLVVPHLVRMLVGAAHGRLMVMSAFLGGLGLLWSDVVARILLPGGEELPVGVVTALVGGPFFCLLLKRRRGGVILD
ncbi:MAG: iron ABC transporter permease [Deltaproteobacteria bacterium]|nr:MAG: iron ABC transporter permease [Deltaproteobacteria bacterium]